MNNYLCSNETQNSYYTVKGERKMKSNKIYLLLGVMALVFMMMSSAFALEELWSVSYSTTRFSNRAMDYNPATGHILVTNNTDTSILVYDTTGQYVKNLDMGTTVFTGGYMPYDLDVTEDGVIWALNYSTGSIFRWANENAAPTLACEIGGVSIRGFQVTGAGANAVIFTTFAGNSSRCFIPVSSSNYTTFQFYEQFGDSSAGSWTSIASGDTSNAVVYQIYPTGTRQQFAKFVKTNGVWSRDQNFYPPQKHYAFKGEICPTNNDVYIMEYYQNNQTSDATTRRDRLIIRIDGQTGIQKEVFEVATTLPQAYASNLHDLAFDTANHIIYWHHSLGVATAAVSNFQLGAVRYTDEPQMVRVMEIPEITVDGNTSDWPAYVQSTSAGWSCKSLNETWTGVADYATNIKLAWNHKVNKLFIMAEVADDVTISGDTWSNNWNAEDLAEFYFNPTNYYEGSSATLLTQMIVKANGSNRAAGFGNLTTWNDYAYIGAQVAIDSTSVAGKRFYEISVPLYDSYNTTGTGTVHALTPNEYIGFEADFVDQDGTLDDQSTYTWFAISPGTSKLSKPIRMGTVQVKGVILSPANNMNLTVGLTQQFNQSGGNGTIVWNSSNTAAGTIDASGLFTALAPGVTQITATDADGIISLPIAVTVVATNAPLAMELME